MNSFKKGSGNLDFSNEDEGNGSSSDDGRDAETMEPDFSDEQPTPRSGTVVDEDNEGTNDKQQSEPQYPYFVRRNNVLDERDTRYELHVRDAVTDREMRFRNALGDILEINNVSKTDAREFALLFAFENPEGVAELMREEGISALK